jgi:hypothetical protein
MAKPEKETRKKKWQRIAKSKKVKFQDNDTIIMLITAVAYKVGIDPEKTDAKKLEEVVEAACKSKEKPVATKSAPKKIEDDPLNPNPQKPAAKKPAVKITPPVDLKQEKNTIKLPNFKNVPEMKEFCVAHTLNKVDGYIPTTKLKKTVFLQWIKDNLDKAVAPTPNSKTDNPNSPSAGIGEMERNNISKAVNAVGPGDVPTPVSPPVSKKVAEETPPIDVPELSTSNNDNEPPTALSENQKTNDFKPDFAKVEEEGAASDNSEMEAYGRSIESHINNSFEVGVQQVNLPRAKFNELLGQCSKLYTYELQNKGDGNYLEVSDHGGNTCRVPEDGYLRID